MFGWHILCIRGWWWWWWMNVMNPPHPNVHNLKKISAVTRYTVCSWYDWFLTFLPVMSPSHYSVYVQWAPHRCSLRIPKTLLQFGSVRIWSRNPPKASRPPAQKQPVSSTWQLRCLYRVPPPLVNGVSVRLLLATWCPRNDREEFRCAATLQHCGSMTRSPSLSPSLLRWL